MKSKIRRSQSFCMVMRLKIRNLNYVIALTLIRRNETLEYHTKELDHGLYWLNELAEILYPNFNID